MLYDERLVSPMREELVLAGFVELRTAKDVDVFMSNSKGTTLVVINSVCGCAAGMARPGVLMALKGSSKPDRLVTVFAGQDVEATSAMRAHIGSDVPPSSPSMALFRDGALVWMMPRHQIEGQSAEQVCEGVREALSKFCV